MKASTLSKRSLCIVLLLFLSFSGISRAGESIKIPQITKKNTCPVCGMFVYKYPEWVATVVYSDGTAHFFDGAKDMFKHLQNLEKYGAGHSAKDIVVKHVTEYYELDGIDAEQALYVIGSDVYGPMGHELIPFKNLDDAREFLNDHKGKRIVSYQGITPLLIENLDQGKFN